MRKIVLLCVAGMSTSLLMKKMEKAAADMGYMCSVEAHPIDSISERKDADIILLGPQVRFQLEKSREKVSCPVELIDMMAYGTMDGKKVIEFVKKVLGDQ